MKTSNTFVLQQPLYGGLNPKFSRKFQSRKLALEYQQKLLERLDILIHIKRSGTAVGNKTLDTLLTEREELNRLEVVQV